MVTYTIAVEHTRLIESHHFHEALIKHCHIPYMYVHVRPCLIEPHYFHEALSVTTYPTCTHIRANSTLSQPSHNYNSLTKSSLFIIVFFSAGGWGRATVHVQYMYHVLINSAKGHVPTQVTEEEDCSNCTCSTHNTHTHLWPIDKIFMQLNTDQFFSLIVTGF